MGATSGSPPALKATLRSRWDHSRKLVDGTAGVVSSAELVASGPRAKSSEPAGGTSRINMQQMPCLVRPLHSSHMVPSPRVLKWPKGWGHSDRIHGGSSLLISSPPKGHTTTLGIWTQPEFWGDTHSDHSRMTPLNDLQDLCQWQAGAQTLLSG